MLDRLKGVTFATTMLSLPTVLVWLSLGHFPHASYSVTDRLLQFGAAARDRVTPHFARAGVAYPPARIILLGLKSERRFEIYAGPADGPLRFIRAYSIHAASGRSGPKLRSGDRQVPEGIYRIRGLNPNSVAYVSLMIDYPNAFDRARARHDGRRKLGGDIVVHGPTAGTEGCIALADKAVEDIFTLVADAGVNSTKMLISPRDLRRKKAPARLVREPWNAALYARISTELSRLPAPGS
jgi:hypothetical protein